LGFRIGRPFWRLIPVVNKVLFTGKDEVAGWRTGQASHAAGEEVTENEGGAE